MRQAMQPQQKFRTGFQFMVFPPWPILPRGSSSSKKLRAAVEGSAGSVRILLRLLRLPFGEGTSLQFHARDERKDAELILLVDLAEPKQNLILRALDRPIPPHVDGSRRNPQLLRHLV